MAIGPFSGETPREEPQVHRRLTDRAVFLGDAGRISSKENDVRQKTFSKLVRSQLGDDDEDPSAEDARPADVAKDYTGENEADAGRMAREGGQDEAEKSGGGSHGHRPAPLLGMGMMPSMQLLQVANLEGGGRPEGGRGARELDEIGEEQAHVEPRLLEGLRQAGLRQPLTGLLDSRLSGERPRLEESEGWRAQPLAGGTLYTWQLVDRSTYQRVHAVDGELMLESSAGSLGQVLRKKGGQYFARLARQDGNARFGV